MKIIVVGGTGIIGSEIVKELASHHEIIVAGHRHGDLQMDITDAHSIEKMFKHLKSFDALISATGEVKFEDFNKMTAEDYFIGINNKLMGQVNLVLIGRNFINDHGSFTLTSGILAQDPIRFGSSASMVNAAIDGFIRGACNADYLTVWQTRY